MHLLELDPEVFLFIGEAKYHKQKDVVEAGRCGRASKKEQAGGAPNALLGATFKLRSDSSQLKVPQK